MGYKESQFNQIIECEGHNYIYNSATKATILKYTENNLLDIFNAADSEKQQIMRDYGFVVSDEVDEISEQKYIYYKHFFNSDTLGIVLVPSMACNFSCPYCFEEPFREVRSDTTYFSTLYKYAEKEFSKYRHVSISLFGGEPLLFFEEMSAFLRFIKEDSEKKGYSLVTSIVTNGSLLTDEKMQELIELNCDSIQITLDGSKRTHDNLRKFRDGTPSFDHLINIINNVVGKSFDQYKGDFVVRFNIFNNTACEIENTLDLINPEIRGKIYVFFRNIYNTSCFKTENNCGVQIYKELIPIAKKMGFKVMYNKYVGRSCEACSDSNFAYITPDLTMWKCLNAKASNTDVGKIGKILNDGTVEYYGKNIAEWYKAADCFEDDKCRSCSKLPDCWGGCIAQNIVNKKRLCTDFNISSLPFIYRERTW